VKVKWFDSLVLGISRHPVKFFAQWFLGFSVAWTLWDAVTSLLAITQYSGGRSLGFMIVGSLIFAAVRAYPPSSIKLKVPGSNTKISIAFGDLFERDGYIAIPVNEFFDSELGDPVSPHSLHGMVIERHFGGHPAAFDQLIANELIAISNVAVERARGKCAQYPIGTSACIGTNTHKFILFALCNTDIADFKASSTIPNLVLALQCLCTKARKVLGGRKLIVPLAGSGLSGVGLQPDKLLQLILLVLADETKKSQFALDVEVILHHDKYDDIDLGVIQGLWR